MLPPVPNPEFVSFVKIVIQLSPSLKPKVFAVHTSNFRNLQNNYLTLLYLNFVLIEVKLWSVFMIWWDIFFFGHPVSHIVQELLKNSREYSLLGCTFSMYMLHFPQCKCLCVCVRACARAHECVCLTVCVCMCCFLSE